MSGEGTPAVGLGVLGPVLLAVDGRPVPVGGAQAETLLALLLLPSAGPQPVDRLVGEMWPGEPPPSARTQVHGLVHGLRRALDGAGAAGRETLVTDRTGYRLALPAGALDADVFRDEVAAGRRALRAGEPERAAAVLRTGLDRWRGPAFAGIDLPRVRAHADALAELRLAALLDWAEAMLRLGEPAQVVCELGPVLAEQPYQDGVRELVMLALARAGRAADALAAYREGWRLTVDELGVEPPPRLRDLHARILAGAPDTRPPAAPAEAADPPPVRPGTDAPRQLPAPPPDFVGRVAERAALLAALTGTDPAGPPGPASVTGPGSPARATGPGGPARPTGPGGPARPSGPGGPARPTGPGGPARPSGPGGPARPTGPGGPAGANGPGGPTGPDGPAGPAVVVVGGMGGVGKTSLVAEVCGRLRDRFPDGQLFISLRGTGDAPVAAATAAGRCLESLGLPPAAVPPDLESRAALLRDLLADRRVLIVADDAAGEGQLRALLPAGAGSALVVTSRQQLAGLPATARVGLAAFDRADALALLAAVAGAERVAAEPAAAARLVEHCDGLPLAVRIAAARLARTPDGTVAELADRLAVDGQRLDWLQLGDLGVRASLSAGLTALPEQCQLLLSRLAALRPPEASGWVAAALLDAELGQAERALETLLDAHLVTPAGRGVTGPRYLLHDLVRLVGLAAPDDPDERSAAIGRALAGWVALAGVAERATRRSSRTHLDPEPADGWTAPGPVRELVAAAPRRWFDEETPALVEVATQAADLGLVAVAWPLAQRLTGHLDVRCRLAEWESVLADGRRATEAAGDRAGLACLLRLTADACTVPGDFAGGQRAALAARDLYTELGDDRGAALASARAGYCLRMAGRTDAAAELLDQALRLAESAGAGDAEAYVLHARSLLLLDRGETAQARRALRRAVEVAEGLGRDHDHCDRLTTLGTVLVRGGLLAEADRVLRSAVAAGAGLEDLCMASHAELRLAEVLLRLDRPAEAEPLARHSCDTERRTADPVVEADARCLLGEVLARLGRHREAAAELTASARQSARLGQPAREERALLALLDCARELGDEAVAGAYRDLLATGRGGLLGPAPAGDPAGSVGS